MIFRRKQQPKPQVEAERKRRLEKRLRAELHLGRKDSAHAIRIIWEELNP